MKPILMLPILLVMQLVQGQDKIYTHANAHSHNDYEQQSPFHLAYQEQFGSMEADIHLVNGKLYVAHDSKDVRNERTLKLLYLDPIERNVRNIKSLQLLIDIKTEAESTLSALLQELASYPGIIHGKNIKLVISGNRPAEEKWSAYPPYIFFDGRLDKEYTSDQLEKIALISESYLKYTLPNKPWPIAAVDREKFKKAIEKGHQLQKPVRLWAHPDFPEAWEEMMKLGLDFINTDHINELSDFLHQRNKQTHVLPYNRIIQSAGEVVRYGRPDLENHALDVTEIPETGLLAVMERYGIFILDPESRNVVDSLRFQEHAGYSKFMSTYSGIKSFRHNGKTHIIWSAAESKSKSSLMFAEWNGKLGKVNDIPFEAEKPATNAIPNGISVSKEQNSLFVYVVLNGNDKVVKLDWETRKQVWSSSTGAAPFDVCVANGMAYVTNWAGPQAKDASRERAGVPWGLAYTDPKTGATAEGTVSVFSLIDGKKLNEIQVGLHPNAIKASGDGRFVYVSNGSSDAISVINTKTNLLIETISVGMMRAEKSYQGSTPNGLEVDELHGRLLVANGLDNAIAIVQLGRNTHSNGKGKSVVLGLVPTEAFPAGMVLKNNNIFVANLESEGANVIDKNKGARSIHHELASVSIIPMPDAVALAAHTSRIIQLNAVNRIDLLALEPRIGIKPVPVPERLGEPSVFKHVVYIIKENKTYDQVFGDLKQGKGDSSLCVFGENITPNMHALAKQFGWMDNYYASGKSSAEGHQWTDAGMVSDYVEKNVRAWFRSYPHRQADAMVYNKSGFIWNQALDYGKTVRVFGEACETEYDRNLKWKELYERYQNGIKPDWNNRTTIGRLNPIIDPVFPDCDNMVFSDQQRADLFISAWQDFEEKKNLPNLMVLSLPNDHTAGTSPDFPTPDAMVADNDLAVGRIMEMITKSKYWDSTVVFITQDDSQSGWDHISAYRTIGLVASPYSSGKLVTANFNQVSMLRTIEQMLGIPPMNLMDATARLMTDCFVQEKKNLIYSALPNKIPLDKMNKPLNVLSGIDKKMAQVSRKEVFREVDGGQDDRMNRIIWHYTKGDLAYPESDQKTKTINQR